MPTGRVGGRFVRRENDIRRSAALKGRPGCPRIRLCLMLEFQRKVARRSAALRLAYVALLYGELFGPGNRERPEAGADLSSRPFQRLSGVAGGPGGGGADRSRG